MTNDFDNHRFIKDYIKCKDIAQKQVNIIIYCFRAVRNIVAGILLSYMTVLTTVIKAYN